jgi:hypothetical protein|tara:strand:- start:87 stop:656 length:570 start_codon:yes stop_codon:yes gene_type:complete
MEYLQNEMLKEKNPYNIEIPEKDDEEFKKLVRRIFRHRKPDRAYVLLEIQESENIRTIDSDILTLDVWQSIEFPYEDLDTWQQLWCNYSGAWQQEKLKSVFNNGPITVYRGGPKDGFSWTTNKDIAIWFSAMRGSMHTNGSIECMHPVDIGVWEKTVTLDNVVAMFAHEDEVVLCEEDAFDWETAYAYN